MVLGDTVFASEFGDAIWGRDVDVFVCISIMNCMCWEVETSGGIVG